MNRTLRLARFIFSLSLMAVSWTAVAQRRITIRVPLPHGEAIAVVTFDATRLSQDDVRRWMELSEQGRYAAPVLGSDTDCNRSMRQSDVNRLAADISQARQVVKDLDPNAYPPELSRVVMYLKRLQSFWLWRAEQGLAFWQNGKKPELQWDDIDTRESCGNTIASLGAAPDNEQACRIVFFDWQNCVNTKIQTQLGPYPKEDWKNFLETYRIEVKMLSTAGD
jgi:hypothetical protein